jgi:hypothetical protein
MRVNGNRGLYMVYIWTIMIYIWFIMVYVYIYMYTAWWFLPTPLKNMTSSVGMMTIPIYMGKHLKFHGSSHHQREHIEES